MLLFCLECDDFAKKKKKKNRGNRLFFSKSLFFMEVFIFERGVNSRSSQA